MTSIMRRLVRLFKTISKVAANIFIVVIISFFYFIFLAPLGIFIRLFRDYLTVKSKPSWYSYKEVIDISSFLRGQ